MKIFIILASITGFLSVALGAFGAHALEGRVSERGLHNWQTAVQYQMFHTMGLFGVALLLSKYTSQLLTSAGWAFFIGILIFSGSLYTLVLTDIKILGAVTPIGGVAFLVGWFLLGYAAIKLM